MFLLLSAPAWGTPVFVMEQITHPTTDPSIVSVRCPEDHRAIYVGGYIHWASTVLLLERLRTTPDGAEAGWYFEDGSGSVSNPEVHATCIDERSAACIHLESASTSVDHETRKEIELTCPPGSFALGAEFAITGETDGVEVDSHAPRGLLAPVGWTIGASVREGKPSWGLEGALRCVSADAWAHVTIQPLEVGVGPLPDGSWTGWAGASVPVDDLPDAVPLGLGVRLSPGLPGGLFSFGASPEYWVIDALEAIASFHIGELPDDTVPSLQDAALVYTDEAAAFEESLGRCADPSTPLGVIDRFAVGGKVWFGLAGGGDGIVFLPGRGPIPVDPVPFREAFAALPVGIATYRDAAERDVRLREIGAALSEEETSWSIVDTAEATLKGSGVVMVVPRDEQEAVRWLSAYRDDLAALEHTTLVFLQQDGDGEALLAEW